MRSLVNELATYQNGERKQPVIRYVPELSSLPRYLTDSFELSFRDAETNEFLHRAGDVSVVKLLATQLLMCFVSRTTANGIMGRGGMFVLSTAQARVLLRPVGSPPEKALPCSFKLATLLDIGAGDGGVTSKLEPLFEHVSVTEYSISMRWRLRQRGYHVLGYQDPFHHTDTGKRRYYDVISCLNVLDRASTPLTLLREMRDSLSPNGLLLLAVVLPWCPFVENGGSQQRPAECLPMDGGECCKGASYEESLVKFVENVLQPCGFKLIRWSRLPYLCEGNLRMEYALLNDAILVLRREDNFTDTATLA